MEDKQITFPKIINAVCDEMGYTPDQLSTPRLKSEVKMSIAKIIASYLLKSHNLGTYNEIKRSLGYTGKGSKTIKNNVKAMLRAIELNDELVIPHLNNIYSVLNGDQFCRLYSKQEIMKIRLQVKEDDIIRRCKDQQVYPFVVRTANQLLYCYAIDTTTGQYIGQSANEYFSATM